jgi:hypothetical protein
MAHPRKPRVHDSTNEAVPGGWSDKDASDNPIDPRVFGLAKAAYGVGETLDLLSIGRTSLCRGICGPANRLSVIGNVETANIRSG